MKKINICIILFMITCILFTVWIVFDVFRLTRGDLNLDGKVDLLDLSIMSSNFKEDK